MAASTDIHTPAAEKEDRILRLWTPILLRTILVVAAVILILGLILMTTKPDFYVARFHAAQAQQFVARLVAEHHRADLHRADARMPV